MSRTIKYSKKGYSGLDRIGSTYQSHFSNRTTNPTRDTDYYTTVEYTYKGKRIKRERIKRDGVWMTYFTVFMGAPNDYRKSVDFHTKTAAEQAVDRRLKSEKIARVSVKHYKAKPRKRLVKIW